MMNLPVLKNYNFAKTKKHETGTIRKHWNRATIYAETKRVLEVTHVEFVTRELKCTIGFDGEETNGL